MNWQKSIRHFLDNLKPLQPIPTGLSPKIEKDPTIRAIVFDIYGTLLVSASGDIDQAELSAENFSQAIKAAGGECPDDLQLLEKIVSAFGDEIVSQHEAARDKYPYPEVDIIEVWQAVFEKFKSEINPPAHMKSFAFIFELLSNKVWPMPNMAGTIDFLRRRKMPLGIVSNAQFYTPVIMNWFLTGKVSASALVRNIWPDLQVYSYLEKRAKPDVALFDKLALLLNRHYSIKPEQCLYVGNDMLKDVWAAKTKKFKAALFAGDRRSLRMRENDERVQSVSPDFVVTELEQIRHIVGDSDK